MSDMFHNWDPVTAVMVSVVDLADVSRTNLYVRQICSYNHFGESLTAKRHINGQIDIMADYVEEWDDVYPGKFIVLTTSSFVRGTYVDLERMIGRRAVNFPKLIIYVPPFRVQTGSEV